MRFFIFLSFLFISLFAKNIDDEKLLENISRMVIIGFDGDKLEQNSPIIKTLQKYPLGGEVRLRGSYVIRADEAIRDADGNITELHCSYDPETLGKNPEGRKVKGVIHWVPAAQSVECEVRLYDRLFSTPNPDKGAEIGRAHV